MGAGLAGEDGGMGVSGLIILGKWITNTNGNFFSFAHKIGRFPWRAAKSSQERLAKIQAV